MYTKDTLVTAHYFNNDSQLLLTSDKKSRPTLNM